MPALQRRALPAPIAEAMSAAIHQGLRREQDARWSRAARGSLILRAP